VHMPQVSETKDVTKELSDYWGRLTSSIHPDDTETFRTIKNHGFNLDFPPPAFIGDIINARVIILDNNGGYKSDMTPHEFPDQEAHAEYRWALSSPRPLDPAARSTSPYYLERNYSRWLISGDAALVNGVAYRSEDGKASGVEQLAARLPSAEFHRTWLRQTLGPLALRGSRFVVVHRWGRWNGAQKFLRGREAAIFSSAPISADLTSKELEAVKRYLGD
jgi:hypothetical protein